MSKPIEAYLKPGQKFLTNVDENGLFLPDPETGRAKQKSLRQFLGELRASGKYAEVEALGIAFDSRGRVLKGDVSVIVTEKKPA